MYEKKIAQARSDLAHVTAVMWLFETSDRPADLARYVDSYRLFKRGEPWAKRLKKHGLKETGGLGPQMIYLSRPAALCYVPTMPLTTARL